MYYWDSGCSVRDQNLMDSEIVLVNNLQIINLQVWISWAHYRISVIPYNGRIYLEEKNGNVPAECGLGSIICSLLKKGFYEQRRETDHRSIYWINNIKFNTTNYVAHRIQFLWFHDHKMPSFLYISKKLYISCLSWIVINSRNVNLVFMDANNVIFLYIFQFILLSCAC